MKYQKNNMLPSMINNCKWGFYAQNYTTPYIQAPRKPTFCSVIENKLQFPRSSLLNECYLQHLTLFHSHLLFRPTYIQGENKEIMFKNTSIHDSILYSAYTLYILDLQNVKHSLHGLELVKWMKKFSPHTQFPCSQRYKDKIQFLYRIPEEFR